MKFHWIASVFITCPLLADNVLHPGSPTLDRPTLVALGIQLPITGDDNFNASVAVRYRISGTGTWHQALPLFRVHPEATVLWNVAPQFAGSIFDLRPGTTYDIELHATDPDGPVDQVFDLTATTRSVPTGPVSPNVRNVADAQSFISAVASAQPGDVIQLADGLYSITSLFVTASGTAANPIVIRGSSEENTILDGGNCSACNVIEVYGSYVHIEQLSIRNAQRAIRFQTLGSTANVVRNVHVYNTIMGIYGRNDQTDYYIADNNLEGRLTWPLIYTSDGGAHANDDGISVAGAGHVVCHNRLTGFGDSLQVNEEGSRAIDFYGNEVLYTYDNAIELDTSEGNTRCLRNRFTNTSDPISFQPILGGPVYVLRNVVVNIANEQMKFHALGTVPPQEPNGILVYHNTFVSPVADLYTCSPATSHHFWIENNLFIGPAVLPNQAVMFCGQIDDGHFDYNGYWPDGGFSFNLPAGGGYAYSNFPNFSSMQTGGLETDGVLLSGQILASGLIGPLSFAATFFAPQDVTLAAGSRAVDRGLVLPNINDGFTGAAPDLGASELGCPEPLYGPRPLGVDETNEPLGCSTVAQAPASLTITKTHAGNFTQGQMNAAYTIAVSNAVGAGSTNGAVTVTENVPSGLTLVSMSGMGWTCPGTAANNCIRNDVLNSGSSYPPLAVTVNVAANATSPQVNSASVGGGGSVTASTTDSTSITANPPVLSITESHTGNFAQNQVNALYTVTVSNGASAGPTSGTVTVTENMPSGLTLVSMTGTGWTCPGTASNNCNRNDALIGGSSFPAILVKVNVAPNAPSQVTNQVTVSGGGSTSGNATDITTVIASAPVTGLSFVPVTPCRLADTRNTPNGPFSGPQLAAKSSRDFVIPNGSCGIPASAVAYSLNVTVVPPASLGFVTVWPSGQPQPLASTLNALDGRIKANAAIIAAGTGGAVSIYANAATDLVLDIDGYFVPSAASPSALAFYPLTPCRIADTRASGLGQLGAPSLVAKQNRTFPVLSSTCNVPASAQAYSLNFTAVPSGPFGFMTAWPTGQTRPLASMLNDPTGTNVANAAIIPAGTNGSVDVYATAATDLIIDIDGYFAAPGAGGFSLYTLSPCRVLDTRVPSGSAPFAGEKDVAVASSACGAPASAQAYVFNATVVPPGPLGFVTLWPQGTTRPFVSTLNAADGQITSNLAIVPSANGSVASYANAFTHLILDIFGYFAP